MARVLLVEDDHALARIITEALGQDGHTVDHAPTGHQALAMAQLHRPGMVILDLGLPDLDGLDVLGRLRERGDRVGVLVLTARDAIDDRVSGLRAGADDYLGKPFAVPELLARVQALTRRGHRREQAALRVGPLRLDPASRRVWHQDAELALSPREFALLVTFMRHPGEVLDRATLYASAWDPVTEERSNVVNVYVRYLRAKIDEPFGTDLLQTVRGHGYRLATT